MVNKINYRRWGIIVLLLVLTSLPLFVVYAQDAVSENLVPCDTDCGYNDFLLLIKNVSD